MTSSKILLAVLIYLFESSKNKEAPIRFATLKAIIQLVEIAPKYVLFVEHVMVYFNEVAVLIKLANDDGRKMDSLRYYHLLISQYYVDYYATIASGIQDMLPIILDFYEYNLRRDLKVEEEAFRCLHIFLFCCFFGVHNN